MFINTGFPRNYRIRMPIKSLKPFSNFLSLNYTLISPNIAQALRVSVRVLKPFVYLIMQSEPIRPDAANLSQ